MPNKITKHFQTEIKALKAEEGERSVVARISTITPDRDGDIMLPSGIDAEEFAQNPVVLFMHGFDNRQGSIPIGKAIELKNGRNFVQAKMKFADRPESLPDVAEWFPDTLLSLFQQKILRAFSIGFNILEARPADDKDREKFGDAVRQIISKWKLLEFSVVAVPANQEALATSVSKGIDIGNDLPRLWPGCLPKVLSFNSEIKTPLRFNTEPKPVLELTQRAG